MKGWQENITGLTEFNKLPPEAKDYIHFIEDNVGTPVSLIGTSASADDIISV